PSHQARRKMVAEVQPHAGKFVLHRNAVLAQQIDRPDPRQLQQFRRIDGAGVNDHFAARGDLYFSIRTIADVGDADSAIVLDDDASNQCMGAYFDTESTHGRTQKGARGTDATAAVDRTLIKADTFLGRAVMVGIE